MEAIRHMDHKKVVLLHNPHMEVAVLRMDSFPSCNFVEDLQKVDFKGTDHQMVQNYVPFLL
jgi:hypothetical protein